MVGGIPSGTQVCPYGHIRIQKSRVQHNGVAHHADVGDHAANLNLLRLAAAQRPLAAGPRRRRWACPEMPRLPAGCVRIPPAGRKDASPRCFSGNGEGEKTTLPTGQIVRSVRIAGEQTPSSLPEPVLPGLPGSLQRAGGFKAQCAGNKIHLIVYNTQKSAHNRHVLSFSGNAV